MSTREPHYTLEFSFSSGLQVNDLVYLKAKSVLPKQVPLYNAAGIGVHERCSPRIREFLVNVNVNATFTFTFTIHQTDRVLPYGIPRGKGGGWMGGVPGSSV